MSYSNFITDENEINAMLKLTYMSYSNFITDERKFLSRMLNKDNQPITTLHFGGQAS
jgi:hypothetical protein